VRVLKNPKFPAIEGLHLTTGITEVTEDTEITMFFLILFLAVSAIKYKKSLWSLQ